MRIIVLISRVITGLVFIFSGFVKSVDPVGTQIKFGDYFGAMGIEFLMPYALFFSFLLNAAEFIIGLMLIFNVFSKLTSWSAFILLMIFTPLTLWLAVANPVSDCGCFGDAIPLTNWQTFWKNVIFLIFVLIFLIYEKKYALRVKLKKSLIISGIIAFAAFAFQFYNYYNLPIIDFRPFKVGVNIKEASEIPEDAEQDVYETILYYKNLKTGESQKFTIDNIPYEDTLNWAYDTTITELIKKGYEPPIYDFFLSDINGFDQTDRILNNKDVSFIIVMHDIKGAIIKVKEKLYKVSEYAKKENIIFWCFTSSESSEIEKYRDIIPENIMICTGDYKMLKTLVRSNPGFVILKNAVILNKYHYINIPDIQELDKIKGTAANLTEY